MASVTFESDPRKLTIPPLFPHKKTSQTAHQRQLSGFTADYKLKCIEPGGVCALWGGGCCQRPEHSTVTWASSWLSFTLHSLMRPDSWSCGRSAGWMLRG